MSNEYKSPNYVNFPENDYQYKVWRHKRGMVVELLVSNTTDSKTSWGNNFSWIELKEILARLYIGTTSHYYYKEGFDLNHQIPFSASYKDLTQEGKDLHKSLEKLYPNCTITILTNILR